jgi:hypothetical protein
MMIVGTPSAHGNVASRLGENDAAGCADAKLISTGPFAVRRSMRNGADVQFG